MASDVKRRMKSRFVIIPENEKGLGGNLMSGGAEGTRRGNGRCGKMCTGKERKVVLGYGRDAAQRKSES